MICYKRLQSYGLHTSLSACPLVGSGALLTAHTIFYVADMNKVPSCATPQGGEDETSIMDLSKRAIDSLIDTCSRK